MFKKILVVCVGNICRSPMGEVLLKKYAPQCTVQSAGVKALEGHSADEQMQILTSKYDVDLSKHVARQLTEQMCQEAELILVMESGHTHVMEQICAAARGKTMLFGQWLGANKEIADPYQKSDDMFALVADQIDQAARSWAKKLG